MVVTELEGYRERCTGCFACFNVCPKDAIKMLLDDEGFFYPHIDNKRCVECGRCVDVCSIKHMKRIYEKNEESEVISVQADDAIREKSSSGGIFYYFAKSVLDRGGIVYGAAYDKDSKLVCHTSTDQTKLEQIMRSKYVQSNIKNTFREVRANLQKGREVLFCGTPCQVRGLYNYLNKDWDNLLTIDFVCHGVPSSGFFKDMVEAHERDEESLIEDITFREKDKGWRTQVIKFYYENNKVLTNASNYYYYYYLFLHNISLRRSCYVCPNPENHCADITVWDDWNIEGDDNKGTSAILLNTQKAANRYSKIKNHFLEIRTQKIGQYKSAFINHDRVKSYQRCLPDRERFFVYYKKYGYDKTLKKWYPAYFKRSVLTTKIRVQGGRIKAMLKRGKN